MHLEGWRKPENMDEKTVKVILVIFGNKAATCYNMNTERGFVELCPFWVIDVTQLICSYRYTKETYSISANR